MAGNWTDANPPIRPGMYINFETFGTPPVPKGNSGIVAIPITADWGPVREFVLLDSDVQFQEVYGPNAAYKSYLVQEAFRGGALQVLAYRMHDEVDLDTNPGKATLTLDDADGPVINLTAKYAGTRADNFNVTVRRNPIDTLRADIFIYEGDELREKFTDIGEVVGAQQHHLHTAVIAAINDPRGGSKLVTAELDAGFVPPLPAASNARLLAVTNVPMAGGVDGVDVNGNVPVSHYVGDPLTGFVGALDAFEFQGGYDVFTLPDIVDTTLITAVIEWTIDQNERGNYVMTVIGGDTGDTLDQAITRSETAGNEFIVNVGITSLRVTSADGTVTVRRPAAMTARVAGMIADAGIGKAITFGHVSSPDSTVEVAAPMAAADIEEAITSGVVVFTKRGGNVVVEDGITTFTDYTIEKDVTFGTIKSVRTMQQIARDFNDIIEGSYIGQVNNTAIVRSSLLTVVADYLQGLEATDVLIPGSQVLLDESYDNTGNDIHLLLIVQFGRELKRVLIKLRAPTI